MVSIKYTFTENKSISCVHPSLILSSLETIHFGSTWINTLMGDDTEVMLLKLKRDCIRMFYPLSIAKKFNKNLDSGKNNFNFKLRN